MNFINVSNETNYYPMFKICAQRVLMTQKTDANKHLAVPNQIVGRKIQKKKPLNGLKTHFNRQILS